MSDENEPGEGNSPAAWTGVTVMLLGFAVGTVAFFLANMTFIWIGVAIVVLGAIAGFVLSKLGYGAYGDKYVRKAHD